MYVCINQPATRRRMKNRSGILNLRHKWLAAGASSSAWTFELFMSSTLYTYILHDIKKKSKVVPKRFFLLSLCPKKKIFFVNQSSAPVLAHLAKAHDWWLKKRFLCKKKVKNHEHTSRQRRKLKKEQWKLLWTEIYILFYVKMHVREVPRYLYECFL